MVNSMTATWTGSLVVARSGSTQYAHVPASEFSICVVIKLSQSQFPLKSTNLFPKLY